MRKLLPPMNGMPFPLEPHAAPALGPLVVASPSASSGQTILRPTGFDVTGHPAARPQGARASSAQKTVSFQSAPPRGAVKPGLLSRVRDKVAGTVSLNLDDASSAPISRTNSALLERVRAREAQKKIDREQARARHM